MPHSLNHAEEAKHSIEALRKGIPFQSANQKPIMLKHHARTFNFSKKKLSPQVRNIFR